MTNQEKKRILLQYRSAGIEEQRLEEELERWRSRAEKATAPIAGTPSGGGDGKALENAAIHIIEVQQKLKEQYDRLARMRLEIDKAINRVSDPTLQELLKLRYIDGYTWGRIADTLGFEVRHVTRLHGYALTALRLKKMS